jgi:hypothetical protein
MFGAMHYVMLGQDAETAVEFAEQVIQGSLLQPGDPAFAFRRIMANTRPGHKPEAQYVAALFVKAWNLVRSGKQINTLLWRPASGEPFPEVK